MDEDLKNILQKLTEQSEENNKLLKKMDSYLRTQRILGYIKILVIVVPIILALIFLPPLLQPVLQQYQELLGINGSSFKQSASDLLKNSTK